MSQKLKPITDAEVVPARKAEFRRLVWAVPLFIVIHNSEEALTMPRWLHDRMPAVAQQYGLPLAHIPSPGELYLALAMGTAVPFLITFFAARGGPRGFGLYLLAGIQSVMLTNAIVPHLIATILLREYTPGVVTAVFAVVPFSIFWFRRILKCDLVAVRPLIFSIVVGALAYGPIMMAIYVVSGWV
jgi:hypothetical protein